MIKIPKTFIPNKNQDEKVKNLIRDEKFCKIKKIDNILSLTCIPEKISDYDLRTNFKMLDKIDWAWHFEDRIPPYIIQAGEMTYQKPSSLVFTSVYILEFKSKTDLNKINKKMNLEKEINTLKTIRTKCLKKDKYLVTIKTNYTDKCSLDVFGSWYVNNFGLEEL